MIFVNLLVPSGPPGVAKTMQHIRNQNTVILYRKFKIFQLGDFQTVVPATVA